MRANQSLSTYIYQSPNHGTAIPTFMCPSDPANPKVLTKYQDGGGSTPESMSQGQSSNYVACAGSTAFNPSTDLGGQHLNGVFFCQSNLRLTDITDGTSNTLMLGEIILNTDTGGDDYRGRIWNGYVGQGFFCTAQPPNTSIQDDYYCFATSTPPQAPCYYPSNGSNVTIYQRSYHTGGVNSLFGDGSVHFLNNSINPSTYSYMGSRADGQVLGDY